MDDRIQRALDGELPRDQLTPAEATELAAAEAGIGAVLHAVPVEPLPDLAPAVMRRIEELESRRASVAETAAAASPEQAPIRSLFAWIWKPRPISIGWRPAYGFAAAAVLALTVMIGRETAPVPHDSQQVLTQFLLNAPDAQQVTLAGDFTEWQPAYTLTRSEPGVWTVVVPLDPGIHNYAFVVDGEQWVPDPNAPAVDDGFGGLNSRLAVLAPDEGGR
ncbi:MAG: glycogen-binding domain-containing protein [Longimicrobiales bacterium]